MSKKQRSFDVPKVWVRGSYSAYGGFGQTLRGCLFAIPTMVRKNANHQTIREHTHIEEPRHEVHDSTDILSTCATYTSSVL
jgi:hypothetical protein